MDTTIGWRETAGHQGEVVARRQLVAAGMTRSAIEHRSRRGDLHTKHPGVFALGRPDVSEYGRAWAAWLATHGRSRDGHVRALTGRSAAALTGHLPFPLVHEVVVLGAHLHVDGISVHRTRDLPPEDLLVDDQGLVITAWPRMLIDLTPSASVALLEDVLASLAEAAVLDLDVLDARLARAPGRATRKLARATEDYRGLSDGEHRSLLERLADRVLVRAGLPRPEMNGPVLLPDGRTVHVDLLYRDAKVAIEIDGRAWHTRGADFETDRIRDRQLQLLGFVVPRFAGREVRRAPGRLVRDVRPLLTRGR